MEFMAKMLLMASRVRSSPQWAAIYSRTLSINESYVCWALWGMDSLFRQRCHASGIS